MPNDKPMTHAALKEKLLLDFSARQNALHADIESRRQAIPRLHNERTTASACQDAGKAQQLGRDIAEHHRQIDAATLELRRLGEQIEAIDKHHDLVQLAHVESVAIRSGMQAELAAAREAFQALLTPELQAAAQRLVHASRAMGTGFEPSILAKAVAGERIHLADAL